MIPSPTERRGCLDADRRSPDGQFRVQYESAGIWIGVSRARRNGPWASDNAAVATLGPRRRVEIEGVTDPGGYAPVILPRIVCMSDKQGRPAREPAAMTASAEGMMSMI